MTFFNNHFNITYIYIFLSAINCSDTNLNYHIDENQASVMAGIYINDWWFITNRILLLFLNAIKNIDPSTSARLPGTGEMYDFW